jgi:IS1 family transposase
MVDVSRETVLSLLVRVGEGCERIQSQVIRNLSCDHLELDEIWGYVAKKQRQVRDDDDRSEVGDTWTFVALDADTKLVPCFRVGKRDAATASAFVADLASQLRVRPQFSSDGLSLYISAVQQAFGCAVDDGQVIKSYEAEPVGAGRYSPPRVTSIEKSVVFGRPDIDAISTAYVERHNLDMRMQIRRLTRLTNAFSKKLRNHRAATALHFAHDNLVRIHRTTRTTPAIAARVTSTVWSMDDLLDAALHAGEA